MRPLTRGRYRARLGEGAGDVLAAQALRHLAFHGTDGLDQDAFDLRCQHFLVENDQDQLVACCRLQVFGAQDDLVPHLDVLQARGQRAIGHFDRIKL